jgi:imidazolonepropionase-like amidohydrolase
LESATLRPAQWFALDGVLGTVDVGKRADLVLLDANPLDDINNTKLISAVVTKGQYLTKQQLADLVGVSN